MDSGEELGALPKLALDTAPSIDLGLRCHLAFSVPLDL